MKENPFNKEPLQCGSCTYYRVRKCKFQCTHYNKEVDILEDACNDFKPKQFTLVDVSGTGYDKEIKEMETGKTYGARTVEWKLDDMYYQIQELYEFRLIYNAHLFNEWAKTRKYEVYKSRRHHDGKLCFDGEWFVVVAILPTGQITNHYHIKDWELFKIPTYGKVKDEFDGHTSCDVLERLKGVIK